MLRSGSNQLVAACALLALTTAAAREAELKPALVRRPIQAEPAEGFKPQSGRSAELGEQLLADCRDGHLEQFDLLSAGASERSEQLNRVGTIGGAIWAHT